MTSSEVQKITKAWLEEDELGTINEVVTYLSGDGKARQLGLEIRMLPGTMIDQIEDSLIVRDDQGAQVAGRASMAQRSMLLIRLSLGMSQQDMDALRKKPLNLLEKISQVCENINGHGQIKEAEDAKNEEGEDGLTSDSESSPPSEK